MKEKVIPKETWYSWKNGKQIKWKEPKYKLVSAEEEKAHQEKLGNLLSYYYGTSCRKCCGVYPKFFTEGGFRDYGYYVCLVCGRESLHQSMNWLARDSWNNGEYEWIPEAKENEQISIFDYMEVIT